MDNTTLLIILVLVLLLFGGGWYGRTLVLSLVACVDFRGRRLQSAPFWLEELPGLIVTSTRPKPRSDAAQSLVHKLTL